MKRFLLVGLVFVLLAGYALMAMGSSEEDVTSVFDSGSSTDSTKQEQKSTAEKTTTNKETEKNAKDELKQHQAIAALENYGKSVYPYGFEVHITFGKIKAIQSEDGSWDLEYKVTITNQYGTKYDAIASAYINNTTKRVENFKVRQN